MSLLVIWYRATIQNNSFIFTRVNLVQIKNLYYMWLLWSVYNCVHWLCKNKKKKQQDRGPAENHCKRTTVLFFEKDPTVPKKGPKSCRTAVLPTSSLRILFIYRFKTGIFYMISIRLASNHHDEAIYRMQLYKRILYSQKLPYFSIKHQKLFSFSCFRFLYTIIYIYSYKHFNTTHIFDISIRKEVTSKNLKQSPCNKSPRRGELTPVEMPLYVFMQRFS